MTAFSQPQVAIIGAGPAGLMAAEVLCAAGATVHVYDAMPSVGRKFLLAGLGGLNITHAEPLDYFVQRYAERSEACAAWLNTFGPEAVCEWVKGLGLETFVGSSQRVFPTDMKAAPLLRAWLHRLRHPVQGKPVTFHMRHRWNGLLQTITEAHAPLATGFELRFDTPNGPQTTQAHAVVLALGGGSWAKLGSDGAWQPWLKDVGMDVAQLRPANCGFDVQGRARADGTPTTGWSQHLAIQFAGMPLKSVALKFNDTLGHSFHRKGEFVVTATGIEGNLVYAASALLRDEIERHGHATLHLDLKPDFTAERVLKEVKHPRGSRSLSSHLKSRLNLTALHLALLHEVLSKEDMNESEQLAAAIKHLPITLTATRPIDEAISSAGGVRLEGLTDTLMSTALAGVFVAGEMLDWEAPTGGYLLTACLASGRLAGLGALNFLPSHDELT
jgi:uncharacterized flavoprotein (TIGR03862 family)